MCFIVFHLFHGTPLDRSYKKLNLKYTWIKRSNLRLNF